MEIKNIEGLTVSDIKLLVQQGAKFVVFPYTVSFIIMTLRRNSEVYFIRPGESTLKYSYGYVLLNLIVGWWGIPWGPIYTIGALLVHFTKGKDYTEIILSELIQNDPEANISTYNIGGVLSSNQESNHSAPPTYNIPS
jgi:hypothetical protein